MEDRRELMRQRELYQALAGAIMDYGITQDQLAKVAVLRESGSFGDLKGRKERLGQEVLRELEYFSQLTDIVEECVVITTDEDPDEYAERLKNMLEGQGNIHFTL
jgi:hypothetical protein|tara:strand:- start:7365 stop:7679 length:315 start_codon:yes stop_codon:yes gene_type:complete